VLGLGGYLPETVDPDEADMRFAEIKATNQLSLSATHSIPFNLEFDIDFDLERTMPRHSNALTFAAFDNAGRCLVEETWYSVGGGFIVREGEEGAAHGSNAAIPFNYRRAAELLSLCEANSLTIADLVLVNERALRPEADVLEGIDRIAAVMFDCIERGIRATGQLPGGLKVQRRARLLYEHLNSAEQRNFQVPHEAIEHVNIYAIAVNEGNAAGGRVVTAPTKWCRGRDPGRSQVLSRSLRGRIQAWSAHVPSHGRSDRITVQDERVNLRRGGRVPGRSWRGVFDGGGRTNGRARRYQSADRECC